MKVICFGDSNTYGFDPRSPLGSRYEPDSRWVDILAAVSGWDIHNNSLNGREIPRRETVFPKSTQLLIIMLGTNDLLQGNSPETVCSRMETFVNGLQLEKDRILILSPPPMRLGEWVQDQKLIENSRMLANCYRRLAAKLGIRFIDTGSWDIPLAFDGVHFTEDGNRKFARKLYENLNKFF